MSASPAKHQAPRISARVASVLGLWFLGLLVASVTARQWIQLNDEGLMLQAVARISEGEVPYRDFWWFYPPGQPYLLALIWKITGPSLIGWRIVRAVVDATVAVLAFALARRRAGPYVSFGCWLAAILAVSSATGPHPYPVALAFALGAILALARRPALAGALAGLVAAWRIEFAAYLVVASVLGLAVRGERARVIGRFCGAAAAVVAIVYIPLFVIAGAGNAWRLLIRYPLLEFSQYQSLPFPLVFDGGGNAQGMDLVAQVLSFHVPLMLLIVLLACGLTLLLCVRPGRWIELVLFVFGIGMAHYLLVRADAFHVGPLAVVDAVLAAWAVSAAVQARRSRRVSQAPSSAWGLGLSVLCAGIAALGITWVAVDNGSKRYREFRDAGGSREIQLAVADGVRELSVTRCSRRGSKVETCRLSDLESAVGLVQAKTDVRDPIYVATKRSDLVTAGAPLFYVLAGRPNASRYDIAAPGVITSAPVQREIIRDLARARAVVVRDSADITAAAEPNRAGQSTNVRLLDDWIAANYRVVARFGVWTVLEFRGDRRLVGPDAR